MGGTGCGGRAELGAGGGAQERGRGARVGRGYGAGAGRGRGGGGGGARVEGCRGSMIPRGRAPGAGRWAGCRSAGALPQIPAVGSRAIRPCGPRGADCCPALSAGGRGQDGSPVITFPDYPAFGDVPDQDFQNVMTYLTSIPRCVRALIPHSRGAETPPRPGGQGGCSGARVPSLDG